MQAISSEPSKMNEAFMKTLALDNKAPPDSASINIETLTQGQKSDIHFYVEYDEKGHYEQESIHSVSNPSTS